MVFPYFPLTKHSIDTLNESKKVMSMTPDNLWNVHKIAYSETEDSMLDLECNLVEKNDRVRIMTSDIGSSERIERKAAASEL